ncbi:MAG: aminoacyl-tRNA hydrolase [Pseudomonadota bacterium]
MSHTRIKAIIGLGNPGPNYADTRHNAGAWYVQAIANQHSETLKDTSKLFGHYASVLVNNQKLHLFNPSTYMNESGKAVAALCQFYKLAPEEVLVAHDELDFDPGVARFKHGGGHAGHNGLRDIIKAIDSTNFWRLRLGIGHPGNRKQVSNFVLKSPSKDDKISISNSIDHALRALDDITLNQMDAAIQYLHSQ